MAVPVTLALSGDQHEHLKSFLSPATAKKLSRSCSAAGAQATAATGSSCAKFTASRTRIARSGTPMRVTWPPGLYCADAGPRRRGRPVGR